MRASSSIVSDSQPYHGIGKKRPFVETRPTVYRASVIPTEGNWAGTLGGRPAALSCSVGPRQNTLGSCLASGRLFTARRSGRLHSQKTSEFSARKTCFAKRMAISDNLGDREWVVCWRSDKTAENLRHLKVRYI